MFRRNSTTPNLIAFRKARALARRVVTEAKRASWKSYIDGLNRFTPISEVWTRIKRISGRCSSVPLPVLRLGSRDILHSGDVANEIGKALRDRCAIISSDSAFMSHRARCEAAGISFDSSESYEYNDPFTLAELNSAIATLRCVAEGPDTVHNEMLRRLPASALAALLALFNSLWETGT